MIESRTTNSASTTTLLLLLICGDLAFILLHLVNVETRWLQGVRISLEAEGGMPETYQYIKEFWIAACMAATFWRTRVPVFAIWAGIFAFLLVDDAGQIHEQMGVWLGQLNVLPTMFGLRQNDVGELLFAGAIGVVTVTSVGLAYWRGSEQTRRISRDVLLLVLALAVMGVFVDVLHVISYLQQSLFAQVLLVIEDGGEMLVMSTLTAYCFHVASHDGRAPVGLWEDLRARITRRRSNRPTLVVVPADAGMPSQ
jgi:hypothetical protein